MNTILPNYQRTHSSMASRKRVAAEVAKKPKPVFPTSHSPHPPSSSNVERMSIADSAILRASLTQSRYNWTHSAFSKFTPEPAPRNPGQQGGGKRYISEVTPAGVYTVCIGPHMFFETKFFTVYTPPPPAPPPSAVASLSPTSASASISTSATGAAATAAGTSGAAASSSNTAASTPTDLPSSPVHVISGGSPAPERVIELILARTSTPTPFEEEAKETDGGAKSLPSELAGQRELETTLMESIQTLEPVVMDSNKNNFAHVHGGSSGGAAGGGSAGGGGSEASSRAGTPVLGGGGVSGSSTSKRAGGSASGGSQAPRPPRPERQVAFEFKDNPGHRWLFPQEASVDFTPAGEGSEYGKVSASFCLPVFDDNKMPVPPGQMTTMVIVGPSQSLYEGILAAVNDPTVTYKTLMEKMKHIPPRAYPEYQLPIDYPDEKLEPLGLKKLPDHKVVPLASLQPSKRKPDGYQDMPSAKQRRSNKAGQGYEENVTSSRPSGSQRRGVLSTNVPAASSSLSMSSTGTTVVTGPFTSANMTAPSAPSPGSLTKRCVYCGCTSTPMWRRGPAGPSTLCNACGVKWKNGKILQETPKPPSGKSRGQHASVSSTAAAAVAPSSLPMAAATSMMATPMSSASTNSSANTPSTTLGGTPPVIGGAAASSKRGGTAAATRGAQKTTVEAAAELLKNFVEAVNNPRQNGMNTATSGGQSMSRSSSARGSSSKRSTGSNASGGGHAHTSTKRDASQMSEKSVASESEGSRISEAEKMVPVKKRHSSKAQAAAVAAAAAAAAAATTTTPTPSSTMIAQTGEQGQKGAKGSSGDVVSTKDSASLQTGSTSKSTRTNAASASTAAIMATSTTSSTSTSPSNAASPATTGSAPTTTTNSPTTPSAPTVNVVTPTPTPTASSSTSTPTAGTTTTTPTPTTTAATSTLPKGKVSTSKATGASTGTSRIAGGKASASSTPSQPPVSTPAGARGSVAKAKANGTTTGTTSMTTSPTSSSSSPSVAGTTATTPRPSPPTSAGAKLELLKALASSPRYQISSHTAVAVSTMNLADDGLSLFATKNLYTNNTATFPLHFPTISIAFGPNNAYYTYPNCAVILYENHFQIKLIQGGERTQIDVWKEGIEGTEFQVIDVGDGESMIVFRAVLRQYMTRFDKELLNPDRNETLIVFRFRERLDGGGPPVKPLLEQWLTTEIPVPPTAATTGGPVGAVAQQQSASSKASPSSSSTSPASSVASTPARGP